MPIDVGDAVFSFLADTTQLDRAYAKVNAGTEAAINPATDAIEKMGASLDQTAVEASIASEQYTAAGRAALRMGEEGAAAGDEMAFSMHSAKGELALLGEEAGITIPRHIRSFVAELPGVGKALNAAFEATAVLFIVQILGEAATKLTEFIADTFIWTEANKEQAKSQVELNKQIEEQVKKLEGLKDIYEQIGLSGSAKTGAGLQKLTQTITENEKALQSAKDVVFLYTQGYIGLTDEVRKARDIIALLTPTIATQNQDALNQLKLYDQQVLTEGIARKNAIIAAQKATGDAVAALQYQQDRILLIQRNATYSEFVAADIRFHDTEYQIETKALTDKLEQLKRDPTRNITEIIALQAQIEDLDKTHHTKLLKQYGDFLEKLKAASKNIAPTVVDTFQLIENQAGETLDRLKQDFATLGITGVIPLTQLVEDQKKAYDDLAKSGLASVLDLKLAWIQYKMTLLELHKLQGDDVKQETIDVEKLKAEYNALVGVIDKLHIRQFDLFKMWRAEIPTASKAWRDLTNLGKTGLNEFARAAEAAFASAILSESSFGDALRKGTAQVLAEIAARSLVYAVFYTALGFARLAEYDFVGAGQAFTAAGIYGGVGAVAAVGAYLINPKSSKDSSSVSPGKSVTDGTAAPAQQTAVMVQNVQKFAAGGLVTGPTIALIGEKNGGAREAAIPLDDPSAVQPIVDALGGGRGTTIHVHVEGLISPDNLGKVMTQINQRVKKGQGHLLASNAFRVTKRSL